MRASDRRIYWVEPGENDETLYPSCTEDDAIDTQRWTVHLVRPGFCYANDRQALLDFLTVHWACYLEPYYRGNGLFRRVTSIHRYDHPDSRGGSAIYTSMEPAMWQRGDNT